MVPGSALLLQRFVVKQHLNIVTADMNEFRGSYRSPKHYFTFYFSSKLIQTEGQNESFGSTGTHLCVGSGGTSESYTKFLSTQKVFT